MTNRIRPEGNEPMPLPFLSSACQKTQVQSLIELFLRSVLLQQDPKDGHGGSKFMPDLTRFAWLVLLDDDLFDLLDDRCCLLFL